MPAIRDMLPSTAIRGRYDRISRRWKFCNYARLIGYTEFAASSPNADKFAVLGARGDIWIKGDVTFTGNPSGRLRPNGDAAGRC